LIIIDDAEDFPTGDKLDEVMKRATDFKKTANCFSLYLPPSSEYERQLIAEAIPYSKSVSKGLRWYRVKPKIPRKLKKKLYGTRSSIRRKVADPCVEGKFYVGYFDRLI